MKGKLSFMWRATLALVLVLSLGLVMAVPVAANVSTPEVTDITNQVPSNATAVYTIEFTTTEDLAIGDAIVIEFPEGTALSTVTDVTPAGTTAVEGPRLSQTLSAALPAGDITVVVTNVTNPPVRGSSYTLKVYTSQEPTRVTSATYIIGTEVTIDNVVPTTMTVGTASVYTITFTPTTTLPDGDTITITFPADTYVPPSPISKAHVTVDGSVCLVDATVSGRTVTVTTPKEVTGSKDIVFLIGAGIKNPTTIANPDPEATTPDEWTLTMYTSRDIVPVESTGDYGPFVQTGATAVTKLVVKDVDTYVLNDTRSDAMYIQAQDVYGNPTDIGAANIIINLSAEPSGGVLCDSSGDPLAPAQVTITGTGGVDTDSDAFYFKSATAGTYTITAAETPAAVPDWENGTADVTVSPKVQLWHGGANYTPVTDDYSTFADAIGAALPYDTIKAPAGVYEESFTVNKANLIIESIGTAAETIIDGGSAANIVMVDALNVTIDGFTIRGDATLTSQRGLYVKKSGFTLKDNILTDICNDNIFVESETATITSGIIDRNTITGMGEDTQDGRSGILVESYGNAISGVEITNNTLSGFSKEGVNAIGVAKGGSGAVSEITVQDNIISDSYRGISLYGVVTGMTGTKAISNNTITGCTAGFKASGGATVEFDLVYNTITGNTLYGVWLLENTPATAQTVTIKYNDLSGNGEWGIYNTWVATTDFDVVATHNYWGSPTGPSAGTGDYASTAVGSGDAVSVEATYTPWLHKSYTFVVADNADYPALSVPLSVGWNTISAPAKLIDTADAIDVLVPTGLDLAYWYDAFNEDGPIWRSAVTRQLLPCDAVYIKMVSTQTVLFQIDGTATYAPSKDLAAGWNLIGLANLANMDECAAVASVDGSYSHVVSPSMNTSPWVWTYDATDPGSNNDMLVGEGYWIFMKSEATLGGFVLCPIAPQY